MKVQSKLRLLNWASQIDCLLKIFHFSMPIFLYIFRMLTILKKQVLDLRSKKLMLEGSLTDTKNENCNLSEQCSSISASYEVLRQHTVHLSQVNTKLSLDQDTLKKELNKLHIL